MASSTVQRGRAGGGRGNTPARCAPTWLWRDPLGQLYAVLTLSAWFVAALVWAHGWTP